MANREFLFDLSESLRDLVQPLEASLSSEAAFSRFLEGYGVAVEPNALGIEEVRDAFDVANALAAATRLSRELLTPKGSAPAIDAYVELVTFLAGVVGSIRAGRQLPAPSGIDPELWVRFAAELPSGLLTEYLESYHPVALALLLLLGVVEEEKVESVQPTGSIPYTRRRFHGQRLLRAVTELPGLVRELYAWDDADRPLDHRTLFDRLVRSASLLGIPVEVETPPGELLDAYYSEANPDRLEAKSLRLWLIGGANERGDVFGYALRMLPAPPPSDRTARPTGLVLAPSITSSGVIPTVVVWPFSLEFSGEFQSAAGVRLEVYPEGAGVVLGDPLKGQVDSELAMVVEEPHPYVLLGSRFSHRLQIKGWSITLRVSGRVSDPECEVELAFKDPELVIDDLDLDAFLRRILGTEPQRLAFELAIVWSSRRGLYLRGHGGLALSLPLNLTLGLVELESLDLAMLATSGRLSLTVGVSGGFRIGPVAVSVEDVGLAASLRPVPLNESAGVLGDLDLGFDFKPPDGLGLMVDAGPIAGGGFLRFDPANGRYAGVLQLEVYGIEVAAVGLLETRLPGGAPGFSFVIVISTEFTPIQLGFGFTLNGVGGLAGIHRTVAVEALQAGIRGETLDHILFPEDPVRDAPQLISDLRAVFPAEEGHYVFGPMALIGWATPTLLEAELGIVLALPDPVLILLGQISAHFPTKEAAVVELHIEVLGVLDFPQKLLAIDARLHDSRVALFAISGAMAFRLSWGEQPSFALALGGLHPHFQPPPGFPALERLTVALGLDENPRISLQAYLALTSNSLQFGAKAELYAAAGDFNIYGWIEFDALVTLAPLYFQVDFSAGVALRWDDETIAGIHLNATLEGPAPWHAWGEACISLLFFDVCVPFDARVGEARRDALPPTDPWPLLAAAIEDARNWSATLPPAAFRVVTLAASAGAPPAVLVDPVGGATLRETVVPLNRPISRFGAVTPAGPGRYDLRAVAVGDRPATWTIVRDYFAPAQFSELTEAEKLSGPSFEKMDAGMTVASDAVALGSVIGAPIEYETAIIDSPWDSRRVPDLYAPALAHQLAALGRSAAARSLLRGAGLRRFAPGPGAPPRVRLADEGYVVASTIDLTARGDITGPGTLGEAAQALADYLAGHPEDAEGLQVIPENELARAA